MKFLQERQNPVTEPNFDSDSDNFAKIGIIERRIPIQKSFSVKAFLEGCIQRLRQVKKGYRLKDKINLFKFAIFQSVPNIVRLKINRFDTYLKMYAESSCKNIIVKSENSVFAVYDIVSLGIVNSKHEEQMQKCFTAPLDGVFIDVGAHVGKYSVELSKKVGSKGLVVAVEPQPKNFKTLKQNIELNNLKNVIPLNLAAWGKKCVLNFSFGNSSAAFHLTGKCPDYDNNHSILVKAEVLDTIVNQLKCNRVDLIKIDAESSEYEVLLGLQKTLIKFKPKIIVEVWKENAEKIAKMLSQIDYNYKAISIADEYNINSPNYNWCINIFAAPK